MAVTNFPNCFTRDAVFKRAPQRGNFKTAVPLALHFEWQTGNFSLVAVEIANKKVCFKLVACISI